MNQGGIVERSYLEERSCGFAYTTIRIVPVVRLGRRLQGSSAAAHQRSGLVARFDQRRMAVPFFRRLNVWSLWWLYAGRLWARRFR